MTMICKKKYTKKGVTFVEMIIAIGIMSAVMFGVALFFIRIWTLQGFIVETGIASLIASRGVGNTIEFIRAARQSDSGAFPILLAADNEMTFYVDYDDDGDTERLHYYIDGSEFRVDIREPDKSSVPVRYGPGDEETRVISAHVVNNILASCTQPVFQYFGKNGLIQEYDDYAKGSLPLSTPARPSDIKMVRVLLCVNPRPDTAPDNTRIQSFAVMRNLSDLDKL